MAEFLRRGRPFGVGERAGAELAGAVVPDRVDPDDLAVSGQLDRGGDDGHLDRLAGPPSGRRHTDGAGEADVPGGVGEAGDRQPGGGVPRPPRHRCPGLAVGLVGTEPLGVGGHHHAAVQDVDQAARRDGLDRLAGVGRPDPVS